jgi:hypothetical protein
MTGPHYCKLRCPVGMVYGAFGRTGIITICVAADVTLLLHLVITDNALARFASRNRVLGRCLRRELPLPWIGYWERAFGSG